MAKFFVGQLVRIVRVYQAANHHLLGAHGRISEVVEFVDVPQGEETAYGLDICPITREPDDQEFGLCWVNGFVAHQLEPILPSGHTASTESFQELMDRLNTQRVDKVEEVGA